MMVLCTEPGPSIPRFKCHLYHFPALWPWSSYLVLLHNDDNNGTYLPHGIVIRIKLVNLCKVLKAALFT